MSSKYGADQDAYCYPGTNVFINLLNITDQNLLDQAELEFTQWRMEQYEPDSFDDFSLAALQKIHRHLFQDLYAWAGAIRTVDISKGNTRFANIHRIGPEADKLFQNLQFENRLTGLNRTDFRLYAVSSGNGRPAR
jgi:cell filamentation protein